MKLLVVFLLHLILPLFYSHTSDELLSYYDPHTNEFTIEGVRYVIPSNEHSGHSRHGGELYKPD